MPTYVLEGLSEVRVKDRALNLSIRIDGDDDDVLLTATQDGRELPSLIRRPNLLIIPRIDEATLVSVAPARGTRFPATASVHLSVTVEGQGLGDPEKAILGPIDVSGLERRDLLSIERVEGMLSLRAARNHQDDDLGPLANAARIAAREVLGVQWVDESSARDMVIALDSSGSMVELVQDGSASDLIQVLTGIAQVVSRGQRVSGALVGSSVDGVDAPDPGQLPRALVKAHSGGIPSGRFLAAAPGLTSGGSPSVAYLLTSSVPADLAGVPAASGSSVRHVVALMDPQIWDLLATGRGASVARTVLGRPADGTTLGDRLLADPVELRDLVRSLLEHDPSNSTIPVSERTGA